MTKEQALQILQEAIDRGIDPDENVEIFDAIKIAIECLQSDPYAPDWSQAPEWAQWYAIDGDGQRWWFEIEPTFKGTTYNGKGEIEIDNLPERMKLFKRPEKE